ncbi:MAG: dihydrolipoamide acetyltransferase family protein [Blastocatellia bacterium]|nr:dihydrolipoamide acetyltransferase family protein [Blastocatellia bacterium]
MAEFVMPALGADTEAGTLVAWLRQPGEAVARGEVIAEIDTDKGVIEVECFTSGVVERLLIEPGQKAPVGAVMAIIREESAAPPAPSAPPAQPAPVRVRISPVAKKLAEESGLALDALRGTGPGGRITQEDVERALAERAAPPTDRHARMRQAIAAAMTRSKRETPHYYLNATIDMHSATVWLAAENAKRSVEDRLLAGVLLIKAVAQALRELPEFNAVWEKEQLVRREAVHVGMAISLRGGGLIAPALRDADRQSLDELMRNFQDLVRRARSGGLRSSELSDATITITSLGDQGVDAVFGIIHPPQTALVGFGRIAERPWIVDGLVVPRPLVTASLSADHRATDGHQGARFLAAIDRLLQRPEEL